MWFTAYKVALVWRVTSWGKILLQVRRNTTKTEVFLYRDKEKCFIENRFKNWWWNYIARSFTLRLCKNLDFFFSNWITYMNTCWEDISLSFVALFFSVLQITLFYLIMVTDSFILFNSYGQGLPWTASSTSVSFKNWNYCLTFFHAEESSVNCAELSGCIKEMKMRNKRDSSLWNRKLFFRKNYSEIHMSWCMERLLTDW